MRWRTRLAVSVFSVQIGRSTASTSAVSIPFTSRSASLDRHRWPACCVHCAACLALRQPGRLLSIRASAAALNVSAFGACRCASGEPLQDGPSAGQGLVARCGQGDLGIWAKPEVVPLAVPLHAQDPRARAPCRHVEYQTLYPATGELSGRPPS